MNNLFYCIAVGDDKEETWNLSQVNSNGKNMLLLVARSLWARKKKSKLIYVSSSFVYCNYKCKPTNLIIIWKWLQKCEKERQIGRILSMPSTLQALLPPFIWIITFSNFMELPYVKYTLCKCFDVSKWNDKSNNFDATFAKRLIENTPPCYYCCTVIISTAASIPSLMSHMLTIANRIGQLISIFIAETAKTVIKKHNLRAHFAHSHRQIKNP